MEKVREEYEEKRNKGFEVTKYSIVLKMGGYDYDIGWDRITSKESLMSWVYHLCEKVWFDTEYVRWFMEIVCEHQGFPPPWEPSE